VQECAAGLVRIRRDVERGPARLAFAAPPLRRTGPLDATLLHNICAALGLTPADVLHHQWIDNGPGWCALMLGSAAQVLSLQPDWQALGQTKLGVIGRQDAGRDTQFEVRAFAPGFGVNEDPVTGSLNAGLAQWLIGAGLAPPSYVAAQGAALGRAGRVHVEKLGDDVWIGGDVVTCIEGELDVGPVGS
jgi:PhzF family phenazine biosynthesis protein